MNRDALLRFLQTSTAPEIVRAREFGVDMTLLARNLSLTPDERLAKFDRSRRNLRLFREMREKGRFVD